MSKYSELVFGTHTSQCIKVQRSTSQSIPSNVSPWPTIYINFDTIQFRSSTSWILNESYEIVIPEDINYVYVTAEIFWAVNPTGDRQLMITKNGSAFSNAFFKAAGTDYNQCSGFIDVIEGDKIKFGVRQSSGGSLNALASDLSVFVI